MICKLKIISKDPGFSFVEVLVSITIIAILSAIGMTGFQAVTKNGRDALRKSDLEQIRSALEIYKSEFSKYPPLTVTCYPDLPSDYIAKYPSDPKPTYNYCYRYIDDLHYQLCAHTESGVTPTTFCGAADYTCGPGNACNYQLANP